MPFPLSETTIVATEQALGSQLPSRYRAFIARSNGGEVEALDDIWQVHPLEDRTDRKRMARTANHVLKETEQARKWPKFPADALCVASNGTGDHLVLKRAAGLLSDEIYFWSHEKGTTTLLATDIEQLAVAS